MPVIDLSGVQEKSFEPVPAGQYNARITNAEEKMGKEHPYINVEITLGGNGDQFDNRKVWDVLSLSPGALFKLKGFLRCIGYSEEDLSGSLDFETTDLVGAEVGVQLKIEQSEEYGAQNRVKKYFPVD